MTSAEELLRKILLKRQGVVLISEEIADLQAELRRLIAAPVEPNVFDLGAALTLSSNGLNDDR